MTEPETGPVGRPSPRILLGSPFDSRRWRWFEGKLDAQFIHVDSHPKNALERRVRRPALSRYRAAIEAGWKARSTDMLVTHSPELTAWTEVFRRIFSRRTPHLAFSFNFTNLPTGWRLSLMRWAFRKIDRFIVFSNLERELYARVFRLPPSRFEMTYWGVGPAHVTTLPAGVGGDYICAVGGEGRDYPTFVEAMRRLPHVRAEIVARPHNLKGFDLPPNVTLRVNIPKGEANAIILHSRFMALPLLHAEVPCGHVTMVNAMKMGKALVATDSRGIADYVLPGKTALLCRPGDAEAMARDISRLWDEAALRDSLGQAGKEFADRHCTEQSVLECLVRQVARITRGV